MEFRYWLDAFMRRGNWTQASLGKAMGVAQVTVGAWVNGKNLPDAKNLRKIAELAGEDPIWLFRQVGYLPPEAESTEAHYNPVLTSRSLEQIHLFNRLDQAQQDLEMEVLRLRVRQMEHAQSQARREDIATDGFGEPQAESANEALDAADNGRSKTETTPGTSI